MKMQMGYRSENKNKNKKKDLDMELLLIYSRICSFCRDICIFFMVELKSIIVGLLKSDGQEGKKKMMLEKTIGVGSLGVGVRL